MKDKRYIKAMLKAIDVARSEHDRKSSKTDGLRVIKRFELVNQVSFDPLDKSHLQMISGNASNERFFRMAGYVLKR